MKNKQSFCSFSKEYLKCFSDSPHIKLHEMGRMRDGEFAVVILLCCCYAKKYISENLQYAKFKVFFPHNRREGVKSSLFNFNFLFFFYANKLLYNESCVHKQF